MAKLNEHLTVGEAAIPDEIRYISPLLDGHRGDSGQRLTSLMVEVRRSLVDWLFCLFQTSMIENDIHDRVRRNVRQLH